MKKFLVFLSIHILLLLITLIIPGLWLSLDLNIWIILALYIFRYAVVVALSLYFYAYMVDKCNLFELPLSFVPLPFIFIPTIILSKAGDWPSLSAISEVILFSGIFLLLTIVVSIVLKTRKSKRQGQSCYQSVKTPKRIVLTGCIISTALSAIMLFSTISSDMRLQRYQLNTTYTEVMTIDMEDEWTSVHTTFLQTLSPDSQIFEITLRGSSKSIEDTGTQQDFESAFNVTLAEIEYKDYYYFVLVGEKAPPNLENGWIPERLDNVNILTVYRVNIVR